MTTIQLMACIGMVVGFFVLLGITPSDFTEGVFRQITSKPKSLRDEINESTQRKKKFVLRREIEESQNILRMTGREAKFPAICAMSLLLFLVGASFAFLLGNFFLVPVLAAGMMFIPFWYIKLTAAYFKKAISAELETALSIITTSYLRNEDIQTAVEENLEYLNPPVKNAFAEFLTRIKLVDPDVDAALRDLSTKIDNAVFREWVAALLTCRYDRGMKTTKGDLYRNYAGIAKDFYGYQIAVLDLRNPTRSDGNNLLHLINKYMDIYKANPNDLAAKAKAEKYSKILAKTLINTSGGDSAQYGQNAFFYDSAEGLLTAMFLLVAEYLPTEDENGNPVEKRHIVSVFKLVQELLAPSKVKGKNQFQILLEKLPPNHKARWFAGSALNTAEQAMASVISTVLSRLNAFLDSEMEQILCFDTAIDAEKFCNEKSAIFIVLPEEDQTKYFMVSLILQNLYREILTVADENGGRLKNRVVFFADELGTCPPIQSLELMFSASRSRGLMLVPIVQSITGQLKKNYGAEGAEVIVDNCQVNLYGGFAPASQTAVELSKALGSRTVMSGSISRGKNDPSQSLQMIERPLMTPDELKSMPKGSFIVAKTGVHPMKVKLRLFLDWGIRFGEPYEVPEKAQRAVAYADKQELEESIIRRHYGTVAEEEPPQDVPAAVGGMNHGMQAEKNSRKTILRP